MTPILPANYFGGLDYFKTLAQFDQVLLEAKEHFPKQSYRTRCAILTSNGIIHLAIPVKKVDGNKTSLDQITIDQNGWQEIHWRSIATAYQAAPYFEYYGPMVKDLIYQDEPNLLSFNRNITTKLNGWLGIKSEIKQTASYVASLTSDYRIALGSKHHGQAYCKAPYIQVFPGERSFMERISILDGLFCEGPTLHNLIYEK